MQLLLDTCCWLWWLSEPSKLNMGQFEAITNCQNQLFLSTASMWEIGIKVNRKKLTIPQPINKLVEKQCPIDNIVILDIKPHHAIKVGELELHHKDPFDRIIIAQAICEDLTVITSDKIFQKYDVALIS